MNDVRSASAEYDEGIYPPRRLPPPVKKHARLFVTRRAAARDLIGFKKNPNLFTRGAFASSAAVARDLFRGSVFGRPPRSAQSFFRERGKGFCAHSVLPSVVRERVRQRV